METCVIGVNKHLRTRVTRMTEFELLSNMHPSDRESFNSITYNRSFKKIERTNR